MKKFQPHSLHRADMLLRRQHAQADVDWEFKPMPRHVFETCSYQDVADIYDLVYDDEKQGLWYRRKHVPARKPRAPANRYARPTTRFGDLMDGVAHITKGLQRIDQATDGDFGDGIFSLFR